MITLFCSNKLQIYIGFKENDTNQNSFSELNNWNAHLFTINRKKGLFFMNHETYFSFLCYDIKKPDIKNLSQLFITGFLFELNKLKLITPEQEAELKSNFYEVYLHTSINNKKVIGNINNLIQILDYHKYEYDNMEDYFNKETLNNIPLKQTEYLFPKEAMALKINQLFKGNLKII